MKTKTLFAALIALFLFGSAISSQALAQKRCGRHHGGPMFNLEMLAEELELTEEQQAQLEEQKFAARKSAIETRSKLKLQRLELHKLMRADTPDESKIKSTVEEMGELKTELQLNRVQTKLNMHKILTPEQREKMQSLKREFRRHRGPEFRQHRRGHGPFRNFQGNLDDFGDDEFDLEAEDI